MCICICIYIYIYIMCTYVYTYMDGDRERLPVKAVARVADEAYPRVGLGADAPRD